MISRAISGVYDEALRPLGLRVSQMNIMAAVSRMGGANPGEISRTLLLEKSTLSRDVERLIERRWLEALPGRDARSHRLRLTRKGDKLLADATPAWRRAQRRARAMLGDDGVAAITRIADAFQSRTAST
jgi:DNA-binding MarR family transcriptional regulator